jgi:hypothetical protein
MVKKSEKEYPQSRSLLELEGLGAEMWKGMDAQKYVDELRDEWRDESSFRYKRQKVEKH